MQPTKQIDRSTIIYKHQKPQQDSKYFCCCLLGMTPPKCWFCPAAVFLWEWSSDVVLCCRFEELYNIRVAYQAFEQFDMKGLLIDQDILLSSIKVGIPEYLATWLSTYTWMDPIKVILESNKCNNWPDSLSGSII